MKNLVLKTFYLILFNISFICNAQTNSAEKINTEINKEFYASHKSFSGKLNADELKNIKLLIGQELNLEIPDNKSIIINYYQYGKNCFEYSNNNKDDEIMIEKSVKISSRIAKDLNAIDFFIYSENALHKEIIEKRNDFIKDSGFFSDIIFTLHENCQAFFILKPNGEFLKHYGTDYFSIINAFLKKK